MLIEQAIYEILRTDSAVAALVAGRIFGGIARQEVHNKPYIVYRADGDMQIVRTLEGGCSLVQQTIRIFSAGTTYGEASRTDHAVITALDEYFGNVIEPNTSPVESIDIQGIFLTPSPAHEHQYVDKTKLHEFLSDFHCSYIASIAETES